MPGLGIGIAFFGYWTFYYGLTQTQGFNFGFLDLGIPGRWATAQSTPKDSCGAGGAPSLANTNPASTTGPLTTSGSGVPGSNQPTIYGQIGVPNSGVWPGGTPSDITPNPYTGPGAT